MRRVTPSRMSSARSASTATASAPSRAALPARASAPKPAPGVTVDVVLPAERAIFTLEHVDAGAREICVALGPFRRAIAFVRDALDGRGGVVAAIAVRAAMVAAIARPNAACAALAAACAWATRDGKRRADLRRALMRGEGGGENETEETAPVMEFTAKDATVLMERAAKAAERAASVAEWRSRTVSAATMYAAMALSGVSAFVRADVMMCAIALYATRPARLRVIPDPINACWSRLPSLWKDQSKIQ